ncbi:MAG: AAA family ATPase [Okeania sp. SIO2C9]|uniref:NB-ARC domain-containing protein n=1 Tax=Okeania sp. SIO2C9 TaxID=2607791 RepID=UPI0013C0C31B|nr:NB-ARC domain-containing protein [Okeania sp. SIO2C9]NEQ73666.1 AAA family ATPase [Okeania sp. SIO2C9]
MNLQEILNLADGIVFANTGHHLDDLQEAVVRGTLNRETYQQIAKNFDCSESSARNAGSELWQILSQELGEEVNKCNLRSAMERFQISLFSNVVQDHVQVSTLNFCGEARHPPDIPNRHPPNKERFQQDLSEMPDLGAFYNRTLELETLNHWVIQQQYRLIAITGISGIGKTALVAQLVKQIKDEFEYVLWCSLASPTTFSELQKRLLEFFSQSETDNSPQVTSKALSLIQYLQNHRCLVVLDDIQNLFLCGELAGKYKTEHEDYQSFFKQIQNLSHKSCFLLIGWEPSIEIPPVQSQNGLIRTLQLTGLDIVAVGEILRDYGLTEIDNDSALIDCYQGNPFWLKSVATQIQELGEWVKDLLVHDTVLLPEDLKYTLQQQWERLSETEKQVMCLLAKESKPINLAKLLENGTIPPSDLPNVTQSLLRRCLIEKSDNLYSLPKVIKQYINRMITANP